MEGLVDEAGVSDYSISLLSACVYNNYTPEIMQIPPGSWSNIPDV